MLPGAGHFEAITEDLDPAARTEAADRCATLLVRGAHDTADEDVVARVVHLADTEGLDTLADLWSGSPADSLAGCLWRLYLLRAWVYADPAAAAREFDAGRAHTPVHEVVAGVVDPPGPGRGAPAHRPGAARRGRRVTSPTRCSGPRRSPGWSRPAGPTWAPATPATPYDSDLSASRLVTMAEQLEHAAALEIDGRLA